MKNEFEYYKVTDWWGKSQGEFISIKAAINYFNFMHEDTTGFTIYHYRITSDEFGRIETTELEHNDFNHR